jgi:hypothetical protein
MIGRWIRRFQRWPILYGLYRRRASPPPDAFIKGVSAPQAFVKATRQTLFGGRVYFNRGW